MKKRILLLTALLVVPMGIAFAQQGEMPRGLSNAPTGVWEKDSTGKWVLKTPQGGWQQGRVTGSGDEGSENGYQGRGTGSGSNGKGPKKEEARLED